MTYVPVPVYKAVLALTGRKDLAMAWWTTSNKAFAGNTPEQQFAEDPDKVASYLLKQLGR